MRLTSAMPCAGRFSEPAQIVEIDGSPDSAELHSATPAKQALNDESIRRRYRVHRVGRHMWVSSPLGQSELIHVSRFLTGEAPEAPGSLLSPMPGKVVSVLTSEGAVVARGDTVVIVEAMKMEHAVKSPVDGVVSSIPVSVGQQVNADQVLAVVEAVAGDE